MSSNEWVSCVVTWENAAPGDIDKSADDLRQAVPIACEQVAAAYCAKYGRWPEEVWYDIERKSVSGGSVSVSVCSRAGDKAPPPLPGQLLPRDVLCFGHLNRGAAEAGPGRSRSPPGLPGGARPDDSGAGAGG